MPDIAMCAATCPVSRECYRHPDSGTKPREYRQTWAGFEPTGPDGCDDYIPAVGWRKRSSINI